MATLKTIKHGMGVYIYIYNVQTTYLTNNYR